MEITPEERATKLVRTNAGDWSISGLERGQMVLDIATAIREAVEAERVFCVGILASAAAEISRHVHETETTEFMQRERSAIVALETAAEAMRRWRTTRNSETT